MSGDRGKSFGKGFECYGGYHTHRERRTKTKRENSPRCKSSNTNKLFHRYRYRFFRPTTNRKQQNEMWTRPNKHETPPREKRNRQLIIPKLQRNNRSPTKTRTTKLLPTKTSIKQQQGAKCCGFVKNEVVRCGFGRVRGG